MVGYVFPSKAFKDKLDACIDQLMQTTNIVKVVDDVEQVDEAAMTARQESRAGLLASIKEHKETMELWIKDGKDQEKEREHLKDQSPICHEVAKTFAGLEIPIQRNQDAQKLQAAVRLFNRATQHELLFTVEKWGDCLAECDDIITMLRGPMEFRHVS